MPHMNDIWENLLGCRPLTAIPDRPILFVDPADPEKRKSEDILEAMRLIGRFNSVYRVALGLNRKEATEVAEVLDLKLSAPAAEVSLEEITAPWLTPGLVVLDGASHECCRGSS